MYKKIRKWIKQYEISLTRITILLLFFLLPFVKLIPKSVVQPPILRISTYPPGYPVEGQSWIVEVWVSHKNWLTWVRAANATVIMHTSLQGDLIQTASSKGEAVFIYASSLGFVDFEARFNNLTCLCTPQQRFVSNTTALLIISVFGIGGPTAFWSTVSVYHKRSKRDPIGKVLSWILLILTVVGWSLCLLWFRTWKFGSEWGFGNRIVSLFNVSLSFDPHLFSITVAVFVCTFLIWMKAILFDNHKSRKEVLPNYIR
jgi:hypothetical protein